MNIELLKILFSKPSPFVKGVRDVLSRKPYRFDPPPAVQLDLPFNDKRS